MGKVIACMNEKGGVAKTTTVKNVAVGFANKGKKVLCIDFDPSANLSKGLGIVNDDELGGICNILDLSLAYEDFPQDAEILHTEDGVDIVTSSNELHEYEDTLVVAPQREIVLRRYVETIKDDYDYIFIDCPAGLGILVTNALFCADSLIIPFCPQYLSVESMQNLYKKIFLTRKQNGTFKTEHPKPEILGSVFTMVRTNTNNDKAIIEMKRNDANENASFLETYIPSFVAFSESDAAGQSIYSYAPESPAAWFYSKLTDEIFAKIENE